MYKDQFDADQWYVFKDLIDKMKLRMSTFININRDRYDVKNTKEWLEELKKCQNTVSSKKEKKKGRKNGQFY